MKALRRASGIHRLVVFLAAAAIAAPQSATTCGDWEEKFVQVRATWHESATSRAALERSFGEPSRTESSGACTVLFYSVTGCSAAFTVCSAGTVVSKTFTTGAAAVPALVTTDPAALRESIESLDASLKRTQAKLVDVQETVDALAPAPVAAPEASPPPRPKPRQTAASPPAKQCVALTQKGAQCSRTAVKGTSYCYQHRK
jgi:hypothetical protein